MVLDKELGQQILSLIDLTSLNATDTEETIIALCQRAYANPSGHVAAVCVYPQFVKLAVEVLADKPVRIATVANFPHGKDATALVVESIRQSIQDGADEIDVVLPYHQYLLTNAVDVATENTKTFIEICKAACGESVPLKVILETGALRNPELLTRICHDVILAGADFLKTSTGKIETGATLEAAAIMLLSIKLLSIQVKRPVGLKVSGGVRSIQEAAQYLKLANQMMGPDWVTPATFRFGASQLLDAVLQSLS